MNYNKRLPIILNQLISIVLVTICLISSSANALTISGDIFLHDPSRIIQCDGKYYIYGSGAGCPMQYSTDLIHWQRGPGVIDKIPQWATNRVPKAIEKDKYTWAPDVIKVGNRYFLFYSYSTFASKVSVIGLYTNTTLNPNKPGYRWIDQGLVLASDNSSDFNAIDPCPILDEKGNLWLSYGSWNSGGIKLTRLDRNTGKPVIKSFSIVCGQTSGPEASYLYKHGEYYYVFENEGLCCQGNSSTYRIMVGRSKSIAGPYKDRYGRDMTRGGGGIFLEAFGQVIGPGHTGIININGTEWLSYHYYDHISNGVPTLGISKLSWSKDGWPVIHNEPLKTPIAEGTYAIISKANGMALTTKNHGVAAGTPLALEYYNGSPMQKWIVMDLGDGYYGIISSGANQAIDLNNCNPADGALIGIYTWFDNNCQRWIITGTNGAYRITSKGGGDITVNKQNNNDIRQYRFINGSNQKWIFKRL